MQDGLENLDESLAGLPPKQWRQRMAALAEQHGMYQSLGDQHFATFIDQDNTLLVTFETVQGILSLSEQAHPGLAGGIGGRASEGTERGQRADQPDLAFSTRDHSGCNRLDRAENA